MFPIKSCTYSTANMERSSPLAAMQPPSISFGQWGCRTDISSSISDQGGQYGGSLRYGPDSFNFKDLSMTSLPTDYFNLKPIRGSSPTASLAADLSQNFHIDQRYAQGSLEQLMCSILIRYSPQLPTPRRSLFSQNLFGTFSGRGMAILLNHGRSIVTYERIECVRTPPIPSSSPGPGNDSMDMSPLPHKAPSTMAARIYLTSPTPEMTPNEEIKLDLHSIVQEVSTDTSGQTAPFE